MSVCSQRHTKSASKTEIRKLQITILVDQQVLGLEITVQDSVRVTVLDTLAQLQHELLHHGVVHDQRLSCKSRALGKWLAASTLTNW